jgi:hypothetical protein
VARQPFYSAVKKSKEPYYAYLQPDDESLLLFWAVPVFVDPEAEEPRVTGVLAARLVLEQCLAQVAQEVEFAFAVLRDSSTLFTHELDTADSALQSPLTINGLDSLELAYVLPPPPEPEVVDSVLAEVEDTLPAAQPLTLEGVVSALLPVLGVLVFLLLVALLFLVRHVLRRRREQAARERERKTGVMRVPRRPPTTVIRARPAKGTPPAVPRTPLPETDAVMPPPTDRQPQPKGESTAGTAEVSDELYQKVRKQVYEDLREETMEEMANERRKMFAKAEVFTRTVETHVNDLTKQLSEAETSWNNLSAAMKSIAFKLKQALEGFEQQGGS